jgi:CheY-like chemotaxis protein
VIILDLIMPLMNGFETLYYLRREVSTSRVPVILIANSRSKSIMQLPGVAQVLAREEVSEKTLRAAIEASLKGETAMATS